MNVYLKYTLALTLPPALGVAWVAVQRAWRSTFPRAFADPDVLAERRSCSGCEHSTECAVSPDDSTCPTGEERP